MQHQITLRSSDRGLTDIEITVPRGMRREGLDLLERAMPAIRELNRCAVGVFSAAGHAGSDADALA